MKRVYSHLSIIVSIILFGIFVYPGLYKYDKIDQRYPVKINRITGSTQILRENGWQNIDKPADSDLQALRNELMVKLQTDREEVKKDIISEIKSQIMADVQNDLNSVRDEISAYKRFETDPDNYFTIGSTKNDVKKIMGTPTGIDDYFDTWYYGSSNITFKNGKVSQYHNFGELRVK